ncbi:MAG: hypothetical protein ACTH69_11255 [Halomonas sp.]|uniref:hypothetical protein n=1 Tax=Halomonas sp. TaxID=1486246 RepID=UPI003F8D971A
MNPTYVPIIISLVSIVVAIVSLLFAMYSWRQTHRPLVSARITAVGGGKNAIPLSIVLENTGSRPAREIELIVKREDVLSVLSLPSGSELPKDATRCFFSGIRIPVLANGRSISNAFGHLVQSDGSWRSGSSIPLMIRYSDLAGRRFTSKLRLLLADDAGFAQTFWSSASRDAG